MKNYFLTVVVAGALLSSCSSAYRTGQTPDDVYFSTGNTVAVAKESREENRRNAGAGEYSDGYQSYWNDADEAYLRMKVRNGGRWNAIDDYGYWNGFGYQNGAFFNPYMYNYSYSAFNRYQPWGFNSFNNGWGFNAWNNHWGSSYYGMAGCGFNPWFGNNLFFGNSFYGNNFYGNNFYNGYNNWNNQVIVNKYPTTTTRRSSLSGYSNPNLNRSNSSNRTQSNSNGSLFRSVFGNPGSNNSGTNNSSRNTNYERPSRTFDSPSSNTNSSGSSSSGSSGGSSRSSGSSSGGRGGRGG